MTMYTPAETIVAAWIMAETGVGPSMASGSQTCSGHWADLPIVPMKSRMPISPAADRPRMLPMAVVAPDYSALLVVENFAVVQRAGGEVEVGDAQQHEHIADAGGQESFDHAARAEGLPYQKPISR